MLPTPIEAKVILPSALLAAATSSFTLRAGSEGWTASALGVLPIVVVTTQFAIGRAVCQDVIDDAQPGVGE